MVAYEPTIVQLYTVLEVEADTLPPPSVKSSIKDEYCKAVLARITKLKLYCTAMAIVLSNFFKQHLSVQQYFNLLEGKLNDLKTDAKVSRIESLGLLTKFNDVATNTHPDAIRYFIQDIIYIEM